MRMTVVNWVQDSDGRYEVSSVEHMKQMMHEGGLYTDQGNPPTEYSLSSYVQTADIDFQNDSTDIQPIPFNNNASFDGAGYSVSNYSYVDPKYYTTNNCKSNVGLFCRTSGGLGTLIVKNVRLTGLWTLRGFSKDAAFLIGAASGSRVDNIECNFEQGSLIDTNTPSTPYTAMAFGTIVSAARTTEMSGVTIRGSVDIGPSITIENCYSAGGIVGSVGSYTKISLVRNLATFPSGIRGKYAGGIIGDCTSNLSGAKSMSRILNAMTGNIDGEYSGGIVGRLKFSSQDGGCEYMVNSMTGNISGPSVRTAGLIGDCGGSLSYTHHLTFLLNYMTGNIISSYGGGIVGTRGTASDKTQISDCINAMNGNVADAICKNANETGFITRTRSYTNFGLTFTTNYSNPSPRTPQGLTWISSFNYLPYFELTGTDNVGNSHEFEFVFGNLSGNSAFPDYTHLVIHRRDILTPYNVHYALSAENTRIYLTYVNTETRTVYPPEGLTGTTTDTGVTIQLPPLTVLARSINMLVLIGGITGSVGYRVTVEGPTGEELVKESDTLELEHNILDVEPQTSYTVRLYADSGSGYEFVEEANVTTLANSSSNYNMGDFEKNGIVNISDVRRNARLKNVLNDLFSTGELVGVTLPSGEHKSKFVRRGEDLSIKDTRSTIIPFYPEIGAGQTINFVLSDNSTTVPILYEETSDSISVDSVTYGDGDSFVLDGQKVTVHSY